MNSWPSSDPLVTSIGGTQLHLDATGNQISPDVVWNDGYGAGGGGLSQVFSPPPFQNSVRTVVGAQPWHPGHLDVGSRRRRGAPVLQLRPGTVGWHLVGGTSEASPLFSGIVALTAQLAHHRLGNINAALYLVNRLHGSGIVDVTSGDISFGGVTGPSAGPGYDLASGVGTVDAARFVPQLALADAVAH